MRVGALCAGFGGIELGLELAGVDVDLAWYAEIDKFASKVMAHNNPGVPNLGDLTAIRDCAPVDIVTAGFPCQPVSVSGSRKGHDDDRWIIRDVVSVWRRSGARWLILENVSGLLSANDGEAFGQVVDSLAETGCVAEWAHLRADAVGAPHIRERWFCVAADPGGLGRLRVGPEHREPAGVGESEPQDEDRTAADTGGERSERRGVASVVAGTARTEQDREGDVLGRASGSGSETAADTDGEGWGRVTSGDHSERGVDLEHGDDVDGRSPHHYGEYGPAVRRWGRILGRTAPAPTDERGRLSVSFVEWMMGLPEGHVTNVDISRKQKLKILGNGVVPQQAAAAITYLNQGDPHGPV